MYNGYLTTPLSLTFYFSVINAKWVSSAWHRHRLRFSTLSPCKTITAQLRYPPRGKSSSCRISAPALRQLVSCPRALWVPGLWKTSDWWLVLLALGSHTAQPYEPRSTRLSKPWGPVSWVANSKFLLPGYCQVGSATSLGSEFTLLPQSAVHIPSADWWGSYYPNCPQQIVLNLAQHGSNLENSRLQCLQTSLNWGWMLWADAWCGVN